MSPKILIIMQLLSWCLLQDNNLAGENVGIKYSENWGKGFYRQNNLCNSLIPDSLCTCEWGFKNLCFSKCFPAQYLDKEEKPRTISAGGQLAEVS